MIVHNFVKQNTYYDSVTLMLISSRITETAGIIEAAVMMGTDHNKVLMKNSGILTEETEKKATGNDLVIGILAENQQALNDALKILDDQFQSKNQLTITDNTTRAKTIDNAIKKLPDLNFAIISLPGRYAKNEAMKCMKNGMHVLLFSDNVSIDEENELKDYAIANNLLMMGPDCGTAIINGIGLGFANVVKRGNIGLVAAAGTGLQEVTVIIDRLGGGISQAIGTGGRDLKEAVGGKMMLLALNSLEEDPETEIIGIISKPPAKAVMEKILNKVKSIKKPVVACFLGGDDSLFEGTQVISAKTLEDTAAFLVNISKGKSIKPTEFTIDQEEVAAIVETETLKLSAEQKYVRGLYSGGTLSYESMLILQEACGEIYSNAAIDKQYLLENVEKSREHTIIDMGDDYFTDGMPHPMIDTRLRVERIKKEASDPETAIILMDCVLGYGCHEDPAGALAKAIKEANEIAGDRKIIYIASVCGTDKDIQRRSEQEEKLRKAGVVVMPTNAQACRIAAKIIKNVNKR